MEKSSINHDDVVRITSIAFGDYKQAFDSLNRIFHMRKQCAIDISLLKDRGVDFYNDPATKSAINFIEMCNEEIKRALCLR